MAFEAHQTDLDPTRRRAFSGVKRVQRTAAPWLFARKFQKSCRIFDIASIKSPGQGIVFPRCHSVYNSVPGRKCLHFYRVTGCLGPDGPERTAFHVSFTAIWDETPIENRRKPPFLRMGTVFTRRGSLVQSQPRPPILSNTYSFGRLFPLDLLNQGAC